MERRLTGMGLSLCNSSGNIARRRGLASEAMQIRRGISANVAASQRKAAKRWGENCDNSRPCEEQSDEAIHTTLKNGRKRFHPQQTLTGLLRCARNDAGDPVFQQLARLQRR
jgi:hypothetical protein